MMRYLSVCSGIEAATVAWHPLGWTPAGFAEIEPFPRAVLEQRHGAVAVDFEHQHAPGQNFAPLFGDFTQIEAHHVGPVDLLVGGTPCQAFSVAGRRLGLDDPRGNLTIEFFRLAKRLSARWVVWENVPGVLSNWSGEPDDDTIERWEETSDFAAILSLFRECGYRGCWRVLDAQYVRVDGFGRAVPQRRRRVFLVGHLGNDARALPVLFDPESLRGIAPPRRSAGAGTAAASGRDPEGDCQPGTGSGLIRTYDRQGGGKYGDSPITSAVRARDYKDAGDLVAHTLRAEGFDASEDGTGRGTPLVAVEVAPTLQAGGNTTGGHRPPGSTVDTMETLIAVPAFAIQERAVSANPDAGPQGKGWQEDVSFTLEARRDPQAVAFSIKDDGRDIMEGVAPTLRSMNAADSHANGGGQVAAAIPSVDGWAVRKLTPRECERLQGFPDDFTAIRWRGKDAPDGPRYKAIGNSMAVNVMRWIGTRIALVEDALTAGGANE